MKLFEDLIFQSATPPAPKFAQHLQTRWA